MSADQKMAELIRRSVEAGCYDLSPLSWAPYMRFGFQPPITPIPSTEEPSS